jgi:short-subunit dehydrogenase
MRIEGSTVLLTGASGGIGHAIARALRARGASLVVTGRRADVLEPLAEELGGRAVAVDLSRRDELERLLGECGSVDILVANAGLPASGTIESFSVEEIDRALDVNLRAPMVLSRALAPAMVASGKGHLVFVSSISGKVASPGASVYNATKYGLRGFAAALRAELRGNGVGVSAVFPGFISDAGMFADTGVTLPPGVGTRTPQDVAGAVVSAIERDRGEIDVAPLPMRAGTLLGGIAPELAARVSRRLGSDALSEQIAANQRDKR